MLYYYENPFERWVTVRDHPNYEVSDAGRIRNKYTRRILRPQLNKPGGYLRVRLDGKYECVHNIVYSSFYDEDPKNFTISYYDSDRNNVSLGNLMAKKP